MQCYNSLPIYGTSLVNALVVHFFQNMGKNYEMRLSTFSDHLKDHHRVNNKITRVNFFA